MRATVEQRIGRDRWERRANTARRNGMLMITEIGSQIQGLHTIRLRVDYNPTDRPRLSPLLTPIRLLDSERVIFAQVPPISSSAGAGP